MHHLAPVHRAVQQMVCQSAQRASQIRRGQWWRRWRWTRRFKAAWIQGCHLRKNAGLPNGRQPEQHELEEYHCCSLHFNAEAFLLGWMDRPAGALWWVRPRSRLCALLKKPEEQNSHPRLRVLRICTHEVPPGHTHKHKVVWICIHQAKARASIGAPAV